MNHIHRSLYSFRLFRNWFTWNNDGHFNEDHLVKVLEEKEKRAQHIRDLQDNPGSIMGQKVGYAKASEAGMLELVKELMP